jgi:uncharacterized protein YbjT (DUF2867 family)
MKIVLTGAAGNITKPLAEKLLAQKHEVSVIGRSQENLKSLTEKGAKAAIGSIEDVAFLTEAFKGADVVYTMIPVPYHEKDWVAYHEKVGNNFAKAIAQNGIKKVVNLGTYGGHRTDGIGPTAALARVEKALGKLSNTEHVFLRPGYFYSNLFNQIASIKNGVIGGNYGDVNNLLLLSHTNDIADAAAEAILTPNFNNGEPYYVVGDIRSCTEVAKQIGKAIGKDELKWIPFSDEDTRNGLKQAGFSDELAEIYVEIGQFFAKGYLNEHYNSLEVKPKPYKIKLEDFAKEFAAVYHKN